MDNNKKLSIIITHHNEDDSLIAPLLQSINNQRGINFDNIEIIISNNCDTPKFPQILNDFPNIQNRIVCITTDIKNKLGYSREFAVKRCHGEWIIFCDCDDTLYCDYTLMEILSQVDNSIDMYHCKELHEVCNENGEIHTVVEGRNYVFLHGKIFKANCLKSIPFNQSVLSDHEDIYTCLYLNGLRVNEAELDLIIYVWRYNKNSVTRINDSEHDYLGLPDLIRCYQYIYDDLKQSGKDLTYHKADILDFIYYKYRQIKITKLKSDKNELEALLSYFILSFDPELDCLQRENPTFGNEPYVDFIHRITKEFTENIHPYWTKYYLYDNYYPVWDIQIKNFRESIRLSYHYFLVKNYSEALTYAKKAFELNSRSYQSNFVYGETFEGLKTDELGMIIMKYFYEYQCTDLVLDTNGIGLGVYDFIIKDQICQENGKSYKAMTCINDKDMADRCNVRDANKVVWSVKATANFNNEICVLLRNGIQNGKINFLIPEQEADNVLKDIYKGYMK